MCRSAVTDTLSVVPDSARHQGLPLTDRSGDDAFDLDGTTGVGRHGEGATATTGGTLHVHDGSDIVYHATIVGAIGQTIHEETSCTYTHDGESGGGSVTTDRPIEQPLADPYVQFGTPTPSGDEVSVPVTVGSTIGDADRVTVQIPVPAGLTFVRAVFGDSTDTYAADSGRWTAGFVGGDGRDGEKQTMTLVLKATASNPVVINATANLPSTYEEKDPTNNQASTTLNPNAAPVADDQNVTTVKDTPVDLTLTATDPDGDSLAFKVKSPAHGTVSGNATHLTYTPNSNVNGSDSFTFSACDPSSACDQGTVAVTVTQVNDAPVAQDQTVNVTEGTPVDFTLSATDVDGDQLTYPTISGPAHGTLSGTAPDLTYTPDADFTGTDKFIWQACDPAGDCDDAGVIFVAHPVNDRPVAADQQGHNRRGHRR